MYKVFLVDDEPFILEGLINIIDWKKFGLEITGHAANGLEALGFIQKNNIDILITDITMPKMNGLQLIKSIKELHSNTKFIVLSGYSEFEYVKECIKLGIENYLLKPVNIQELVSTLVNTIDKIEKSSHQYAYINNDLDILRDNILYRWVTKNIDSIELKERVPLLQYSLEYSFYMVCILKAVLNENDSDPGHSGKLQKISSIYELCRKTICQTGTGICFCEMNGDIIFIFGENSYELLKNTTGNVLKLLHDQISTQLNADTRIAAGDIQSSFTNVHHSYSNAKLLQDNSNLVLTNRKIIFYDEAGQPPVQTGRYPKVDFEAFSKLIISRNKEKVFQFIDDIYEKAENSRSIVSNDIINLSIEIILFINKTVSNFEYNGSISNYVNLFTNVFKLQTIGQLKDCVKNIADNAINCFISEDSKVSPIIKQVLNHISNHYQESLSLKTLGSLFNINPVYLGQLFQKETGELFSNYINKFKIEKAKQMLLNTNLSNIKIARNAGFSNINYFYKKFKKHVGISPSELRSFRKSL